MISMREHIVNVYTVNELDESALNTALEYFQNDDFYPSVEEHRETIKAFEDLFPISVGEWYYNSLHGIDFRFTEDNDIENLSGIRLATYIYNNYGDRLFKGKYYSTIGKYIEGTYTYKHRYSNVILHNSCVLTGYYMDDNILEPVYRFLKNPDKDTNFKDLMRKCLTSFQESIDSDYEHYYSLENFKDMSINNEWEYTANGKTFTH